MTVFDFVKMHFGDSSAQYLRNIRMGGNNNRKGCEYETSYAVFKICDIAANELNLDDFIVSYQHKYAVPYRLTVKPSFNIYRISCDSIYKNEYLGSIVIFAPTSEGRTNFIFTYIDYGHRQYIDLHKDTSNKYFIDSWMVARGSTW